MWGLITKLAGPGQNENSRPFIQKAGESANKYIKIQFSDTVSLLPWYAAF